LKEIDEERRNLDESLSIPWEREKPIRVDDHKGYGSQIP
jgi:hypothetical protein